MEKKMLRLIIGALLITLGLLVYPSDRVQAASKITKTVRAGKTVTVTMKPGTKSCTFNWTAPKAGYFSFEYKNKKAKIQPYYKVDVKLNGKKLPERSVIKSSAWDRSGVKSLYFNCDKGTKVKIICTPSDGFMDPFTFNFKLTHKVPKQPVGLRNRNIKSATIIKLNEKYTTAARQDPVYYTGNVHKYPSYNTIQTANLEEFNKSAGKFDLDWYEFTAPKKGAYLFSVPSTVTAFRTDKKGYSNMSARGFNNDNKSKTYLDVYLKKGEKGYFAVVPVMLNSKNNEMLLDGFLYTCQIKYSKEMTKAYEGR